MQPDRQVQRILCEWCALVEAGGCSVKHLIPVVLQHDVGRR
jgi:hypothetical protein